MGCYLQTAVSGDLRQACEKLQAAASQEADGVDVAVDFICQHLESSHTPQLQNPPQDQANDDPDDPSQVHWIQTLAV